MLFPLLSLAFIHSAICLRITPVDVLKETVYQTIDTINTLPSVLTTTQQKLQIIPGKIESARNSIGQSVDQVRESINSTITIISTLPQVVNNSIQTVSKVSEDVIETVATIPKVVDSNIQVITSIPDEISIKTNLIIEKTTNLPSYVQGEVNMTLSRLQEGIEDKKRRVIAAAVLVKSIVLFPYEATIKVISAVQIISNQIEELKSELAGEITPEKAERLRQRALVRKSQLESRQKVLNTYDATKRLVYEFFDTLENLILNLQNVIEESKKTPEKIEVLSKAVSVKIEDIKQTPTKLNQFQRSVVARVEDLKQTPVKVQRSMENFQNNVRKTQMKLIAAGAYLWRVITLEEAKASIAATQRQIKATQESMAKFSTDLRDPGKYLQRVVKKNTALKILSFIAKLTKDVAVGTFQIVTSVANATLTAKDDEYVKYLFTKQPPHDKDTAPTTSTTMKTSPSDLPKQSVRDVTKLLVDPISSASSTSSSSDSQPPSKQVASPEPVAPADPPADPEPSEPMSFDEWCRAEAADRNIPSRKID